MVAITLAEPTRGSADLYLLTCLLRYNHVADLASGRTKVLRAVNCPKSVGSCV